MRKSKDEIVQELKDSFNSLCAACLAVSPPMFNISRDNKWTPAENFQHLVTATKMTTMAFTLPKLTHVVLYGKPGRTSHGYSKVVENYTAKLHHGAKASGVYVPKKTDYIQQQLHDSLKAEGQKLIAAVQNKWKDIQLDNYQVKHPILGLLTVRELAYFTIYHNSHHLQTVKELYLQNAGTR